MIRLNHISYNTCPDCGAELKGVSLDWQHTNGAWHESITFKCGRVDVHTPNFMAIEVKRPCERSAAYRKDREEQEALVSRIRSIVEKSKVSDETKRKILGTLKYL